jgi:hypothetical protein
MATVYVQRDVYCPMGGDAKIKMNTEIKLSNSMKGMGKNSPKMMILL